MLHVILFAALATAAEDPNLRVDWMPAQPWPMGQRLYVAGHEVNLRAAASTDAPVVRELDLGTPVVVQALLADNAEVGGRPGRWYAVQVEGAGVQGALFGGVLSPARLDVDLDQDGEDEVAVLTWGWEHHKVIRIREPGLSGAQAVTQLDLGPTHDIEGPQEEMWAGMTTAAETGLPLLKVHLPGREMCGSGSSTHYISYLASEKTELGVLRQAIEDHHWSDAPVYDYVELSFEPKARAVTARNVSSGGEEQGEEQVTVTRHVLREGVFVAEGGAGDKPE